MTKLLEKALEAVRRLPADSQDEIALAMLHFAAGNDGVPEPIDPTHVSDVLEGLAQAKRREFASDARWKPHSVALIDEASLHTASCQ